MLSKAAVTVGIDTVLLEIDGPQLVLGRDKVGTPYLCSLVKTDDEGDLFLAVQISSDRLSKLRSGLIDLRSVLNQPEMGRHYEGRFERTPSGHPTINLLALPEVRAEWLPDDGFLLSNFEDEVSDEDVVREAINKNAAVIVCGLNPPEARGTNPKIDADRLAECIRGFQSLVRHATRNVLRTMPAVRKGQFGDDAHVLQVFGFSPGSFNVHFESKHHADLIGSSVVGTAMKQVDELMGLTGKSPDDALLGFERNRGLILSAYQSLLSFVSEEEAPLQYRWSEPAMTSARGHKVSPEAAKAMCAILDTKKTLTIEPTEFVGRFTSVNTDRKPLSWVARDSDLKVRRGVLHETARDVLTGVTIKTEAYLFDCEERLLKPAAGRQSTQLFLKTVAKQ
jgi:hypothetical protein